MTELDSFMMSGSNQVRLLATIYRDERLYLAARRATLIASDFAMTACALVYDVIVAYREKYGKMPSMSTLQDLIVDKAHEDGEVDETLAKELSWIVDTMAGDSILDYKYACTKLVKFIEASRVSRVAMNDPTNTERIKEAVKDVSEISIDGNEKTRVSMFEDCLDLLPQSEEQVDVKIPTGLSWLDFVTNGGLSVTDNEIGVGLAGTGVGKTNMMINFAISAAQAGFRVLFITTELKAKQITRRGIGMAAHIRTSEMRKPVSQWSAASRKRLKFIMESKIKSYIEIADKSDRSYCVSELVGEIESWKRRIREIDGDDSRCKLVIIDWLDMLVPEQKDVKMMAQEWQALKKVMEDIRHMANSQNVAVWTVMQTNRQGSGASKVRLDHVSGAFGKNFFASLVIGLAPVSGDSDDTTISQDIRDEDLSKVKTECDRELHINIIKNRDGVQCEADIYQGPTLRFFKSKSVWRTTEKMCEKGDLNTIFGGLSK